MARKILIALLYVAFGLAACSTPQPSPRVIESQPAVAPGSSSGTSPSATPEISQGATITPAPLATNTPALRQPDVAPTAAPTRIATSTATAIIALTFSGVGKQATSTFEWDGPALFRFELQKSKSIYSAILLDGSDGSMQTILFSGMGSTNSSAVQGLKKGRYVVNISAPEESAWTLIVSKP
jgi:hypothetical protein